MSDYWFANPNSDHVLEYLASVLGVPQVPSGAQIMAFEDASGVLGGWMFERYTGPGGTVTVHWATARDGRRWLRYDMLVMVAIYIFDQLKCSAAIGEVRASDAHVRNIDERIGFEQVATIPYYFPDDDLVVYRMTRDKCRFLPKEFKKEPINGETGSPSRPRL